MHERHESIPDDISPEAIPGNLVEFTRARSPLSEPISTAGYEELMAGQEVSWGRLVREHPMLGAITVAQLVNTGAVYVTPDYDPVTDRLDFRLVKVEKRPGRRDLTVFNR